MVPNSVYDFVGPQQKDAIKQHNEYDGSSRLEYVYTAHPIVGNNDPCMVTRYAYDGASTRVVFVKEYVGTWNSAWDLF